VAEDNTPITINELTGEVETSPALMHHTSKLNGGNGDGRRLPPTEKRKYEVKELKANHLLIARYIVLGFKNEDIAEMVGVTPQTVSNIRSSTIVKEQVAMLGNQMDLTVTDVRKRFSEVLSPKAMAIIERALDEALKDPNIPIGALAIRVAQDALDRGGVSKVSEVHGKVLHGHTFLGLEDLNELKRRELEAIKERKGASTEAVFEEVRSEAS